MTETPAQSKSNNSTLKFCSRCAKPIGLQRVSSLTGWLFQETFCQCRLKEGSGRAGSAVTPAGSLFGDAPGDKDIFDLPDLGDEYEVLERIGKGGMGCVYKVRDVELDRFLAIKVLHDELKDDQQAVSRFEREAKAALKLMHANLVPVFSYGKSTAGAPYLVMDFVDGVSLDTKLKNEAYLDVSSAIAIFIQICDALTHAHQHGIIHRDLKPGNIIITKDPDGKEVAKLVDFGIAKVRSGVGRETQNLTQTGEVFGSPHYMSPEQCLGFDQDSRSDLYSLGCVMYECLSGKSPFEGHNAVQLIAKHLSSEVPPLRICDVSQEGKVNDQLADIVARCLQKDPQNRYLSVELLCADLKQLNEQIKSGKNTFQILPRKLSILRSLFVLSCAASILSGGFVLVATPLPYLVFLPACSAIIGALLINERLNDFVSRTQFQSKSIRDAANSCVNVLVVCHWILAICAVLALITPFLKLVPLAFPAVSASFGAIIAIVVWTGFLQSVESADIQGSISAGKVMHAISFTLLSVMTIALIQYFGVIMAEPAKKETVEQEQRANMPAELAAMPNVGVDIKNEHFIPVGIWEDESGKILSMKEQIQGKSYRVFRIPPGLKLGTFIISDKHRDTDFSAQGKLVFPIDAKVSLKLSGDAASNFAPVLRRFAADDINCLQMYGTLQPLKNVDDIIYYISHWKVLEFLKIINGDLTDFGLSKIKEFKQLKSLAISNTKVTASAVASLPQLHQLKSLDVGGIANNGLILKALKRSANLCSLGLMNSKISKEDLREVTHFPNLLFLDIERCPCVDDSVVETLSGMKSLRILSIIGDKITPKSVPYLANFKSLEHLSISTSGWTEEEIMRLKEAIPKCTLRFSKQPSLEFVDLAE